MDFSSVIELVSDRDMTQADVNCFVKVFFLVRGCVFVFLSEKNDIEKFIYASWPRQF